MFKYEYLCVKLKELRLEMGYTQKQLASLLRISVYRLLPAACLIIFRLVLKVRARKKR